MIRPYKDRSLPDNHKVDVCRNLNNQLFSIKCAKTGLVLAHGDGIILADSIPTVRESARLKVVEDKVRNVHAFLTGNIQLNDSLYYEVFDEIYYNPYTQSSFTLKKHKCEFGSGDVLFENGKAYALINMSKR